MVTFHIDHIVPLVAEGTAISENLTLACVSCSLRKGARQGLEDPLINQKVKVFHPRQQKWKEHFSCNGVQLFGSTATGRATVRTLSLNRPIILAIRAEEELLGRHPSP